MKLLHIIVLLMISLTYTTASALRFRTVEGRHGLPDYYVHDIARDSFGFIWIATQTGLSRFDGNHVKDISRGRNFTTNPHTIAVDGRNNIWAMTNDSLFVYANGIFDNVSTHRGVPPIVRTGKWVIPYGKQGIWILKTDSLYYLDYNDNSVSGSQMPFIPKDAAVFNGGIAMLSPDGNLYIRKREDRRLRKLSSQGTGHARIRIHGNRCWFFDGLESGVDFYDFTKGSDGIVQYPNFKNTLIKDIAIDRNGCKWFGTNNDGIYRFDSTDKPIDTIRYSESQYSLSSNHISALYIDDDMLVAGTSKRGANLAAFSIPEFDIVDTGIESDISFLHQNSAGELQIGFDGGGMAVYRRIGATSPFRRYATSNSSLPSDLVIGVSNGRGPTIFGTYGGGIFSLSSNGSIIQIPASDSLRYCRHIISEPDGTVWAGTFQNGLFKLGERNYNKDNSELRSDCITGISMTDSAIIVATSDGLAIIDRSSERIFRCPTAALAETKITTIFIDSRGLVWIGTPSGVMIADKKFRIIGDPALSNNLGLGIIRAIIEDSKGRIWVTTPGGISYITVTRDSAGSYCFAVKSLTENNGLGDISFNRYSLACTTYGLVLAGGFGKYLVINPNGTQSLRQGLRAYVTDVYVNGMAVEPGQAVKGGGVPLADDIMSSPVIELDYYNNLQLAIGSSAPADGSIKYEWRLDGGEWAVLKSDMIVLGEMSPGKHTLEVKVVGDNVPTDIEIHINPPFFRSTVAYILYAVVALLLCLALYYKIRNRHQKALGEQRVENAIARLENAPVSPDDKFITDAKKIIEENMDQEDFSVERLSELLLMSRSGLYKKMTAVTGQTPLEFIRMVRMREGRRLLDSGESSIAQIAYCVGMSPKQFSKYFKDETGLTPSQYLRNLNGENI